MPYVTYKYFTLEGKVYKRKCLMHFFPPVRAQKRSGIRRFIPERPRPQNYCNKRVYLVILCQLLVPHNDIYLIRSNQNLRQTVPSSYFLDTFHFLVNYLGPYEL